MFNHHYCHECDLKDLRIWALTKAVEQDQKAIILLIEVLQTMKEDMQETIEKPV